MPEKQRGMKQFVVLQDLNIWLPPMLLSVVLLLCNNYSYLLFHTLAELFAIVVGVLMFVVAAYTRKYARDNFIMYLAIGYFWVAAMDLFHTLIYKGMAIYPVDTVDYAVQFWIANRYIESLLLLSAPLLCHRWLDDRSRFITFGLIAITFYGLIMNGYFPIGFIEGEGLTDFKIVSEYIICLILVLALLNLYHHQDQLKEGLFPFLAASIVLTICAELAFTNYISVYGPANILGHLFKLFSFWLILYSIVRTSLQDPYEAQNTSRALLQGLRDGIPDLIFYKDNNGVYLGCNQAFCDLIGKKSESEVIGVTDFELFDAEMAQFFCDKDQVMLEAGVAIHNDEWITYPDGSRKLLDTLKTSFKDSEGKVIGIIGISRDITERMNSERLLRKLSQAIEQAGEAIVITDKDGLIEYVNPAFSQVTGYSQDELLGENPRLLKSGKHDALFYEEMWKVLMRGEVWKGKIIDKRKDGTLYPAMLTISPMLNEHGEITNHIGIQQNLTEYEELEEQFHQSQKMEAVGTLIGGIAHDFNNTLAGITGNLYMAKKAAEELPDVVSRLSSVEQLAFSASRMIQQLLTFSRKGTVEMNPISITPFLKEVIKLQKVSVPENISLTYSVQDIALSINGDINLLQQALINLINNARDALESVEKPSIFIELKQQTVDEVFLKKYPTITAAELACISIVDNGSGMMPGVIEHIFEPFYTTKEEGQGTGLGLSMVFGAIESHGGLIEVESEPGKGSAFHIYLPLVQPDGVKKMEDVTGEIISGHGETILLVDDESSILMTIKDVLESLDYNVLTAIDGLQAVEVYAAHRGEIDLLILDVVMPNMGGLEALRQIQKLKPDVKAMFATGYDKSNTLVESGDVDPEMMLKKPYSIIRLSQRIRTMLDA